MLVWQVEFMRLQFNGVYVERLNILDKIEDNIKIFFSQ